MVAGDSVVVVLSSTVVVEAVPMFALTLVTEKGTDATEPAGAGSTRIVVGPIPSCVGIASRTPNSYLLSASIEPSGIT